MRQKQQLEKKQGFAKGTRFFIQNKTLLDFPPESDYIKYLPPITDFEVINQVGFVIENDSIPSNLVSAIVKQLPNSEHINVLNTVFISLYVTPYLNKNHIIKLKEASKEINLFESLFDRLLTVLTKYNKTPSENPHFLYHPFQTIAATLNESIDTQEQKLLIKEILRSSKSSPDNLLTMSRIFKKNFIHILIDEFKEDHNKAKLANFIELGMAINEPLMLKSLDKIIQNHNNIANVVIGLLKVKEMTEIVTSYVDNNHNFSSSAVRSFVSKAIQIEDTENYTKIIEKGVLLFTNLINNNVNNPDRLKILLDSVPEELQEYKTKIFDNFLNIATEPERSNAGTLLSRASASQISKSLQEKL